MNQKLMLAVGLFWIAAACGSGDDSATSVDATAVSTSTTAATTPVTSTTEPAAGGDAVFVISEVVFGDDGHVAVTNIGTGPGSLDRYQICQRPAYFGIDDITVEAGETVYFTAGSGAGLDGEVFQAGAGFGRLRASSGEIALYSSGSFASSDAIVSYVEWGSGNHGRSSVAVGAGIWPDGDFVATDDATTSLTADTSQAPKASTAWTVS